MSVAFFFFFFFFFIAINSYDPHFLLSSNTVLPVNSLIDFNLVVKEVNFVVHE